MSAKIYLGISKVGFSEGEGVSLEKHKWDCGWYWGFGYIGNRNLHTHFDSDFLQGEPDIANLFKTPQWDQKSRWVIRDLFIQAYALKKAAEVYRNGGYQTTLAGTTDIIKDPEMCKRINADLEKVLDTLWEFMLASKLKGDS